MPCFATEQMQAAGLRRLQNTAIKHVIGLDEVGYGAWAGPCCVGAAVVAADWRDSRVKDSKLYKSVTAINLRTELAVNVLQPPIVPSSYVLEASPRLIDAIGLVGARDKAVADAVRLCLRDFPDAAIVMDGNVLPVGMPALTKFGVIYFPKADQLVPAVSAASIIAKTYRDGLMQWYHLQYPNYGFDTNMGYGAPAHERGLLQHGVCPIHRKSYQNIRQLLQQWRQRPK